MRSQLTIAALALSLGVGACDDSSPSGPESEFQNNSRQVGLVNVSTGDVDLLNNVNLAVAANVVATVCGVTIPVAVLAEQVVLVGEYTCSSATREITIDQATPGQPSGPAGGNNSRQEGLINVSLGDVAILNNVNAAVAANVLVTACGLTVPVAILAAQAVATAPFECESAAGPIDIVQSQG